MKIIAEHDYIKVNRKVVGLKKVQQTDYRRLTLYEDCLTTKHRTFLLTDIINISARLIGGDGGLILIHTSSGMYSYTTEKIDKKFIEKVTDLLTRRGV